MTKWWGWGLAEKAIDPNEMPEFWPFLESRLGPRPKQPKPVPRLEDLQLDPRRVNLDLEARLSRIVPTVNVRHDIQTRVSHCFGKSYLDIVRIRSGKITAAPDYVVFPESHEQVEQIVSACRESNSELIAFGGGTNIVGALEFRDSPQKTRVTIATRSMNRLLSLDERSNIARFQAGASGPEIEKLLNERGYTLGHFPDSFEFSTLGGWIATRSAGMQSDRYGRIEDMVRSLKVVTLFGTFESRLLPATSAGPDIQKLFIGSEGTMGIITEVEVEVHRLPDVRKTFGVLFPSFEAGVEMIQRLHSCDSVPSIFRLQDASETELASKLKRKTSWAQVLAAKAISRLARAKGFKTSCLGVLGVEGHKSRVRHDLAHIRRELRASGAMTLGSTIGAHWQKTKYDLPYLRDLMLDYDVMVDVAETATTWSQLSELYRKTRDEFEPFLLKNFGGAYLGCHVSHTYRTGASLYFTFAAPHAPGRLVEQYVASKSFVTDLFLRTGGTLSHHHAVGYDHQPWLRGELGETGFEMLRRIQVAVDPSRMLNPGKLADVRTESR
jgi:alkyldihydroxyacetonephosphate synthase